MSYNTAIHGLVTRGSTIQRNVRTHWGAGFVKATGIRVWPGLYAATKPKARSPMGFLLFEPPDACGTSVAHPDQTPTRARQRGHGGLRIEPGGRGSSFAFNAPVGLLSLFNAMRRHGSVKHTKAGYCFNTVRLRFAQTITEKQKQLGL